MITRDDGIQAFILIATVLYTVLASGKTPRQRRWGFWVSMLSRPAYMWCAWHTSQWGIFTLCWLSLALSVRGIRNNPD